MTVLLAAAGAQADDPPGDAGADDPPTDAAAGPPAPPEASAELTPPELLEDVPAVYPEAARAEGVTGTVVLHLSIDAEGHVTEAEVLEPLGHGCDEAAREAALRLRFAPARRGSQPIAARIRYRFAFAPEKDAKAVAGVPPSSPPPAPSNTAQAEPKAQVPTLPDTVSPVEVRVHGVSDEHRLRRSAEAVHVINAAEARQQTVDLGEVLARTQGVGVQRAAGLGSDSRVSLNGLTDDQLRFYLDGIPLELTGYPFGVANVPVNLVERAEIYRGVVPVRFGADALGGAINLVSEDDIRGTHSSASYQTGSFGTHRLTLSARHMNEPSGWFTRISGFLDRADNDYPMDIDVPDARGREVRARVYRFHDGYRAEGVNIETGLVDRSWADRIAVRGFVTNHDKELQHGLIMAYPYGDASYSELSAGGTLHYEKEFARDVSLDAVAGYAYSIFNYKDIGECVYDWFGRCLRMRAQPGEAVGRPQDQLYWDHSVYGRVNLEWKAHPQHAVRLSVSPTVTDRTGDELRQPVPDRRDPLSAQRNLYTVVSGVEYQIDFFERRLENIAFIKDYVQVLRSEEPISSGMGFRREDRTTHRGGVGDSVRYSFVDGFYAKGSYEWAVRLPRPDEVFGNGFPIQPNLDLKPELSHNVNLGLTVEALETRGGTLRGDLNGFQRDASDLIVLVGNETAVYQNVYSARSLGCEAAAGWTSPGGYVLLDANATYVDFRNTSSKGAFAANDGARIPNRPYLFATGSARLELHGVAAAGDELALDWTSRYVHEYFRGWEGIGIDKLTVEAQLLHSLALTYLIEGHGRTVTFTGELQNITDQSAYDFFGVPRPGRATYFKVTASL